MTAEEFSQLALSFPATEDAPHFDRTAFKVTGKRIYATLHVATRTANVKLSLQDQNAFVKQYKNVVYPIPNKWGLQGWTTVDLSTAQEDVVKALLETAYQDVITSRIKKQTTTKRTGDKKKGRS